MAKTVVARMCGICGESDHYALGCPQREAVPMRVMLTARAREGTARVADEVLKKVGLGSRSEVIRLAINYGLEAFKQDPRRVARAAKINFD